MPGRIETASSCLACLIPLGYTLGLPDGAVAQLGARMTGSHEVTGSIPVSSTITRICFGTRPEKPRPRTVFHAFSPCSITVRKPFPRGK
jgi:hypothetical protein